jgi:hypothetical protein
MSMGTPLTGVCDPVAPVLRREGLSAGTAQTSGAERVKDVSVETLRGLALP